MAILCLRGSSNVSIKEIILSAFSGLISKESSAKKICRPTSAAAGVLSPTGSKGLISFFSSVSAAGTFSASCTAAAFSGALAVSSAAGTETSVLAGSTLAAGSISAAAGFEVRTKLFHYRFPPGGQHQHRQPSPEPVPGHRQRLSDWRV